MVYIHPDSTKSVILPHFLLHLNVDFKSQKSEHNILRRDNHLNEEEKATGFWSLFRKLILLGWMMGEMGMLT